MTNADFLFMNVKVKLFEICKNATFGFHFSLQGIPHFVDFVSKVKNLENGGDTRKRVVEVLQLNIGLYCNQVSLL